MHERGAALSYAMYRRVIEMRSLPRLIACGDRADAALIELSRHDA